VPGPAIKTIGSYEVEREIGRGGMGVVLLARQPALDRAVVLKSLRRECTDDPQLVARFEREAQAAGSVQHQNVVAVHDCFGWRGRSYICQEYVDGTDLAAALGRVRIEPRIAGLIALELTRGLEAIHARGIVHRDLKPANVLLSREGAVKIADFGISLDASARTLTQTGYSIGTPRYMSPEQLYGERADDRSDLFSLGVVLYEMCTGMPPFEEDGEVEEGLIRRIEAGRFLQPRSLNPRVPRALSRIAIRCLRAKAKQRWESAAMVRAALERHLAAPTSLETQREIAQWLNERELIEARGRETVAAASVTPVEPRRHRAAPRWAAAAVLAIAGLAWLVATDTLDRALEHLLDRTRSAAAIEASADRLTSAFSEEMAEFTNVDSTAESALSPLPEQP
jgi:serine/threonine-protein kinase